MYGGLLTVDGSLYLVIGKTVIKIYGVDKKTTRNEKQKVLDKAKRNQKYLFNSEQLRKIEEVNYELGSIDVFEIILEKIENIIPENLRSNFYNNLKTLDIRYSFKPEVKTKNKECIISTPAGYNAFQNSIILNYAEIKRFNEVIDENELKCTISEYVERILIHELIHMASAYHDKDENVVHVGAASMTLTGVLTNNGLNEGTTEIMARKIFSNNEINDLVGYQNQIKYINQLSALTSYDDVINTHFNHSAKDYIGKSLESIIPDKYKLENLLLLLALDQPTLTEEPETRILTNIQASLLSYFEKKLEISDIQGNIPKKVELISSLRNDFIDIYGESEEISKLNLFRKEKILSEFDTNSKQRKRN